MAIEENLKQLVLNIFNNQQVLYIWKITQLGLEKIPVSMKKVQLGQRRIVLEFDKDGLNQVESLIDGSGNLNFSIPEMSLLFEAEILNLDQELSVSYPKRLTKTDNRNSERIQPLVPVIIKTTVNNKTMNIEVHDLSVNGITIICDRSMEVLFGLHDVFKESTLKIKSSSYKFDAQVARIDDYHQKIKGDRRGLFKKVFLKFKSKNNRLEKQIVKMLDEQNNLVESVIEFVM